MLLCSPGPCSPAATLTEVEFRVQTSSNACSANKSNHCLVSVNLKAMWIIRRLRGVGSSQFSLCVCVCFCFCMFMCLCLYVFVCLYLFMYVFVFSFQCVLLGIFLVPIRGILLTLVLMITWPVAVITTFKHPLKGSVEPMTGWRR